MSLFVLEEDVITFHHAAQKFLRGEMSAEEFKPIRLLNGVYQQRQTELYMLRLKIPQGNLTTYQLERIARFVEEFAHGEAHITTRQDIQLYGLTLKEVDRVIYLLYKSGITTREASGNVVRNITACHLTGICTKEAFDVTPYAELLTHALLRHPAFQKLPRKFKIAFSACDSDCAHTTIHDLGLIAKERNGHRGFKVVIGGGLGAVPKKAQVLEEFIPSESLVPAVYAILKIFNKLGVRAPKSVARFKFLVEKLGIETFRKHYYQEKDSNKEKELIPPLCNEAKYKPFIEGPPCNIAPDKEFLRWKNTNTHPQMQSGFFCIEVVVPLGNLTADQMRAIAKVSRYYSDGSARLTNKQNLILPWINQQDLIIVYHHLKDVGLSMPCSDHVCDIATCPGSSSCPSAITNAKAMAIELIHFFQEGGKSFQNIVADLRVSGCHNSCGQHHLAAIGLSGRALMVQGRYAPFYEMYLNTQNPDSKDKKFSESIGKIPAARVPSAIGKILSYYHEEKHSEESLQEFFARVGINKVESLLKTLTDLQTAPLTESEYKDWGSNLNYELKVDPSEC